MSVLSKFKSIKTQKETDRVTWLYERHPLESATLEFRLQYLSALALLTALDREPTSDETKAFAHLGQVLSVEVSEAQGLLSERANVSEDDIETLFAALRGQKAVWNYLADLAWLHCIDGQADEQEWIAFSEGMHILGLDAETTEGRQALNLHALMLSVQTADDKGFVDFRYRTTWPAVLDAVLTATTQKMLPVLEKNAVDLTIKSNDFRVVPKTDTGLRGSGWFSAAAFAATADADDADADAESRLRSHIEITNWCVAAGTHFKINDNMCVFRSKSNSKQKPSISRQYPISSEDIISGNIDELNAPFDGIFIKVLVSVGEQVDLNVALARIYRI